MFPSVHRSDSGVEQQLILPITDRGPADEIRRAAQTFASELSALSVLAPSPTSFRAAAVVQTLCNFLETPSHPLQFYPAHSIISALCEGNGGVMNAALLSPHFALATVNTYRTAVAQLRLLDSDKPFTLADLLSADAVIFTWKKTPTTNSPSHKLPFLKDTGLGSVLAHAVTVGVSLGQSVVKALYRDDLIGIDSDFTKHLIRQNGTHFRERIGEVLAKLENTFLDSPPLTNVDLIKCTLLAAIFSEENGGFMRHAVFDDAAHKLGLNPDVIECTKVFDLAIQETRTLKNSASDLAYRLVRLVAEFVTKHDLRNVEINDLAFACIYYINALHPTKLPDCATCVAQVRRFVGSAWAVFEDSRTATYVNKYDERDLGVTPNRSHSTQLRQDQLCARIRTREQALRKLYDGPSSIQNSLTTRTGSDIQQFVEVQIVGQERRPYWDATFFDGCSNRQFRSSTDRNEVLWELSKSGNYPLLSRELSRSKVGLDWEISRLLGEEARNLPEEECVAEDFSYMEENCPGFKEHIGSVDVTLGCQRTYAIVTHTRDGSYHPVLIAVGIHGTFGFGLRHAASRRASDKKLSLVFEDPTDDVAPGVRFVREVVVPVLGERQVVIPSGRWPQTHRVILGTPPNSPDIHVAAIVANLPTLQRTPIGAETFITSYILGGAENCRKFVDRQLLGCREQGVSSEILESAYASTSSYLRRTAELSARLVSQIDSLTPLANQMALPSLTSRISYTRSLGSILLTMTDRRRSSTRGLTYSTKVRAALEANAAIIAFPNISCQLLGAYIGGPRDET